MKSRTLNAGLELGLTAVVVLFLATTTVALAADAVPPAPAPAPAAALATSSSAKPTEDLEQLDEVVVHGKRLRSEIADAEDDFYILYNKLNTDHKYDTSCVSLNLDADNPTSQIKRRVCLPGFVADAMADWAVFKMRCQPPQEGDEFSCLDRNRDERLSMDEAEARPELAAVFTDADTDHDGRLSRQEFAQASQAYGSPVYQPPPPQLVLMEGSDKWAKQMMKVINSDPRLKEKAGHLDDLYYELAKVNSKYMQYEAEAQPEKTDKHVLGPKAQP